MIETVTRISVPSFTKIILKTHLIIKLHSETLVTAERVHPVPCWESVTAEGLWLLLLAMPTMRSHLTAHLPSRHSILLFFHFHFLSFYISPTVFSPSSSSPLHSPTIHSSERMRSFMESQQSLSHHVRQDQALPPYCREWAPKCQDMHQG